MQIKKMAVRCLGMVVFALLAACGAAPAPKVDTAAATKIVATFMAQITQTAAAAVDLPATAEPTETLTGESLEETETPFVTPTPDAGTLLLGKFRTVTVSNGNLFVRDGTGVPVQITKSGTDHDPIISADGQKIVFYREDTFHNIFIVNADGRDEKELVNTMLLPELADGMARFLTFRPGTYDLLFSSYFCKHSVCSANIYLVTAETAKITKLASGLTPPASSDSPFALSPDGQYMSVAAPKQMDLYNFPGGKLVYANIVSVTPGKNSFPLQYWLPDSNGLIVLAETNSANTAGNWRYSIWRYTLKKNRVEQLPFGPPIMQAMGVKIDCDFSISPDRNWIFYQESEKEYHLDNLKDTQTKIYVWNNGCVNQWSPDSQHFASQTAIGSVDGTSPITLDGHFIAWLDDTHYLFTKGKSILDLQSYIAEVGKESAAVPTNFIWSPVVAVLEPGP